MASIYKLPSGKWIALIRLSGRPPESKTFENRQDAVHWARLTEGNPKPRSPSRQASRAKGVTVSDLLDRFEREVIPTYRSKKTATAIVRALRAEFGSTQLELLTGKVIAEYRDRRLQTGLSGSTVIRELGLLSRAIELARKDWEMLQSENPVRKISKPKPGKARDRRPSEMEINRLLTECHRRGLPQMATAIQLAIETGMRLGELLSISIQDVNLDTKTVRLHVTKNGESRDVPLSTKALAVIETLIDDRTTGRLFVNWTTPDGFKCTFRRVYQAAGVEGLRFHDLRREATSRFFEKGLNPVQVAAITGHKTLQMLQRYTRLKASDLAKLL